MNEVLLNNGVSVPQIGYGTYKSTLEDGYRPILEAIQVGYRHLDTAALYENEEEVGRAVRESGLPRRDFFITSKLKRNALGYDNAIAECEESLRKLGTDYLDLYLIHWPRPDYGRPDFDDWVQLDRDSWRAMEKLVRDGKIRAIGLSNFLPHHIDSLLETAEILPAANQLELHPGYLQPEAVSYCFDHGIAVEAWSPMGRARVAQDPLLLQIAAKYDLSVPELCLYFGLQSGFIILPKSTHRDRMEANLCKRAIVIDEADMEQIRQMPVTGWGGEHPDRERVYF